jgi:hypothetical protein
MRETREIGIGDTVGMRGEVGTGTVTKINPNGRVYVDWGGWGMEFAAASLEVREVARAGGVK